MAAGLTQEELAERARLSRRGISDLGAGAQLLLRRLGVFVGGATLEAIEAVCLGPGEAPFDLLAGLTTLVDTSFLRQAGVRG
jgi:hypothetical protein